MYSHKFTTTSSLPHPPQKTTNTNDQASSTAAETCIVFGNRVRTPPAGWATFNSLIDLSRCPRAFGKYAIRESVARDPDLVGKIGETYVYYEDFAVALAPEEIEPLNFTAGQVSEMKTHPKSFNIAGPPTTAVRDSGAAGMRIGSNTYGLLDSNRPGETAGAPSMRMGFEQQAKRLSQRVLTGPSTNTQVRWLCVFACVYVCVVLFFACVCVRVWMQRQRQITTTNKLKK